MSRPRLPVLPRLLAKSVRTASGCLEWCGHGLPTGYGRISVANRQVSTHRASWTAHRGPIPSGMMVCHRCDNRRCVEIEHLFLGTAQDNVRDCHAKRRARNSTQFTDAMLVEIVMMRNAGHSYSRIASAFGVTTGCISKTMTGGSVHMQSALARGVIDALPSGQDARRSSYKREPKFSADQVREIRALADAGVRKAEIACRFEVAFTVIAGVVSGRQKYVRDIIQGDA